jgi:hypothetical protein
MNSTRKIIFLLALVSVVACTPERRLARLVDRHPELRTTDTVTFRDMIAVAPVSIDTALTLARLATPVALSRGRLEMTLSRAHDTIYLAGKCKADTIVRTLRIPVERIRLVREPFHLPGWIPLALLAGVLCLFGLKRLKAKG